MFKLMELYHCQDQQKLQSLHNWPKILLRVTLAKIAVLWARVLWAEYRHVHIHTGHIIPANLKHSQWPCLPKDESRGGGELDTLSQAPHWCWTGWSETKPDAIGMQAKHEGLRGCWELLARGTVP